MVIKKDSTPNYMDDNTQTGDEGISRKKQSHCVWTNNLEGNKQVIVQNYQGNTK